MNNKKNILFTATFSTPFILTDLEILNRFHTVTKVISSGFSIFFKFLFTLSRTDITFSWFASTYSSILVLLTKIFGTRSILILGGVDVAHMPELNYGIWNSTWKSIIVRYGIMHADVVLAVDPSIKSDAMARARYDGKNISVLPTGHNPEMWKPGTSARANIVLTVATCGDDTRFRIKGIDFLYNVARSQPEISFVLIGMTEEMKQRTNPPGNVEVHPYLAHEQLLHFYQTSCVYFQPSIREALGSSLCEAMLCECYPIGTNVGGIPTVIGTTGTLISYGDVQAASNAIAEGFRAQSSPTARRRIIDHFSLHQRETALLRIISELHVS